MITSFFEEYGDEAEDVLKKCTHIYADPKVFVCGYKTHSDYVLKKTEKVLDIPDTWFVYYAAGNITKLFELFETQKYICFHRLNSDKLRLYDYDKLRNRLWVQRKNLQHHHQHQK